MCSAHFHFYSVGYPVIFFHFLVLKDYGKLSVVTNSILVMQWQIQAATQKKDPFRITLSYGSITTEVITSDNMYITNAIDTIWVWLWVGKECGMGLLRKELPL